MGFWGNMFRTMKDPDIQRYGVRKSTVDTVLKRLSFQRFQAMERNDWPLDNDLRLAEETIRGLWEDNEKLEWLFETLNSSQVQTPKGRRPE